ncbi:MAG: bifunctional glutamate N-acetyltransferase/amino-acid acetyltransferase ArgJ [Pseudomonadota bacterium]|nr:bifunctional glutamate N-acetyltransferase/amino-acid acetyltransferase ArgJ [Pseudomonadota bacterium]
MPVNLGMPSSEMLQPVIGVELGIAKASIRKPDRKDLLVIKLQGGSRVSAVFTRNRFCAAPVTVARNHLNLAATRALVINTGNANAGTGVTGISDAEMVCKSLAALLDCPVESILPFSTGVILEPLPVERLISHLPDCLKDLDADNWLSAAQAIMTTDTVPKASSRTIESGNQTVTVTGIAKGSGMIHPDMATMLAFVATDANISQALLDEWIREIADETFNSITVDGDTSTNDSFLLIATGCSSVAVHNPENLIAQKVKEAIRSICIDLAQAIVRDGEGASKFITIAVSGGRTVSECRKIAFSIAHSPLVKTAFFASDPNLGRILAAIGYAGIEDLEVEKISMYLDDVRVAVNGGRDPSYCEEDGVNVMRKSEIVVRVVLGRGVAETKIWTCDLSHDYVRINADYRS